MATPAPHVEKERNQDATLYVGNIEERATEALIWELFLQVGPVVNVFLPKDRISGQHQGYGFIEYLGEEDADYALKILNMIKIYGKPLRINKAAQEKPENAADFGATLFIGNLDQMVDEKLLYDTFTSFGPLLRTPAISRDIETGESKGFGFIYYDNFESSDAALEAMNGQFLMNRSITVTYAMKKDSKGERHGNAAERLLAASAAKNGFKGVKHKNFVDLATHSGLAVAPLPNFPQSIHSLPPPPMMPMGFPSMPPGFHPGMMPLPGMPMMNGMIPPPLPGMPFPMPPPGAPLGFPGFPMGGMPPPGSIPPGFPINPPPPVPWQQNPPNGGGSYPHMHPQRQHRHQ